MTTCVTAMCDNIHIKVNEEDRIMLDRIIDTFMIVFIVAATLWVGHYWITKIIDFFS